MFSQSTHVVSRLIQVAKERSPVDNIDAFIQRFNETEFGYQLSLNMFRWQARPAPTPCQLSDLSFENLQGLIVNNPTNESAPVLLRETLTKKATTTREAWSLLARATWHTHPIGDYRRHVECYRYRYRNANYLAFHGDGNCVTLGVMLESFFHHFMSEDLPEAHYSCGPIREFMHVFNVANSSQQESTYIDLDQKIFCQYKQLDQHYSPGLLGQLFGKAGFLIFEDYEEGVRHKLFPLMTHELLSEYHVAPGPIIYQANPEVSEFAGHFARARAHGIERVDLASDDYDWKPAYRKLKAPEDESPFFLKELKEPVNIQIPAGGSLEIGFSPDTQPREVFDLACVFFGRVPGTLSFKAHKGENKPITTPELPWLIYTDENLSHIEINGTSYQLNRSQCGRYHWIGMGQLYPNLKLGGLGVELAFNVSIATHLHVIFPMNALAISSGALSFEDPNLVLECSQATPSENLEI
ncbi:MAG: hypothetical protein VX210_14145 [Myxococcota bacterium]|nr:hypothetical protein [Myxococcota bacterium]